VPNTCGAYYDMCPFVSMAVPNYCEFAHLEGQAGSLLASVGLGMCPFGLLIRSHLLQVVQVRGWCELRLCAIVPQVNASG